ncbi:methylated-DNA--[protein]-cysteine S-methyltransferase [Enterococcus sp. ALS3]|uniref:Methylated-DNA--[protein]-cysteine S-methyltransferase n=1 Tax=Enterococcus alishanensis TaxID=1303817 RepID=A0ABS6TCA1_9ENTE|nr:methylated-DNA--[protein]-cysteine S-methyltransferase [Enterococcus alishanensis]MBV7390523.1 methylated-DNA--[protein]-cysteine S-methyltransferase [Enterococcus alishanensis]
MHYYTYYNSPLGKILLVSDGVALITSKLECHRFYDKFSQEATKEKDDLKVFEETKTWLNRYFAGENPSIKEIKLKPVGSHFRQVIWKMLCNIAYGETVTYGELARQAAIQLDKDTMSAQAVGGAVGHNPISIIIPCHRVIGCDGNLTGYGGGLKNKIHLLKLEGVDTSEFKIPTKGTAL